MALSSSQVGIVGLEKGIGDNQGQFLYIHEQPPAILPIQSAHVNHISTICEDPKVA